MTTPQSPSPAGDILPPDSRYRKRRRLVSWAGLVLGFALGLAGALSYTWVFAQVEVVDVLPHQLDAAGKQAYVIGLMARYNLDGDLGAAVDGLIRLDLGVDPIGAVADLACDLAQTGAINTGSGMRAVRNMKAFYQGQGRTGCADALLPDVDGPPVIEIEAATPTRTLVPPPTKTATPPGLLTSPTPRVVPTNPARRAFEGRIAATFCDSDASGIIEVYVQTANGDALPGERVRVRWLEGASIFATGLKPGQSLSYADFTMEPGISYTVDMPAQADPVTPALLADRCITDSGAEAITSYRVVFRQTN
jgi:hypothetical protein